MQQVKCLLLTKSKPIDGAQCGDATHTRKTSIVHCGSRTGAFITHTAQQCAPAAHQEKIACWWQVHNT